MKDYLGDSVYAEACSFGSIRLTTENGFPSDPSNVIYLDKDIVEALIRFAKRAEVINADS